MKTRCSASDCLASLVVLSMPHTQAPVISVPGGVWAVATLELLHTFSGAAFCWKTFSRWRKQAYCSLLLHHHSLYLVHLTSPAAVIDWWCVYLKGNYSSQPCKRKHNWKPINTYRFSVLAGVQTEHDYDNYIKLLSKTPWSLFSLSVPKLLVFYYQRCHNKSNERNFELLCNFANFISSNETCSKIKFETKYHFHPLNVLFLTRKCESSSNRYLDLSRYTYCSTGAYCVV